MIASTGDSGEDIAERVGQITGGKGAYAAVDAVGGDLTGKLLAGVRPRGTLLIYGVLSGRTFTAGIPDVLFQLKVGHTVWQCSSQSWQRRTLFCCGASAALTGTAAVSWYLMHACYPAHAGIREVLQI